jgi:sigma-E factor negative regulatory protein RseC
MILESATLVAIESDAVWVDAVQKSACESCVAKKGCGTRVLAKLTGKTNRIRVLAGTDQLQGLAVGDKVTIGIPEDVLVTSALLVYILPLLLSLLGLWLVASPSDVVSAFAAVVGLLLGATLVSLYSYKTRHNPRINPILCKADNDRQLLNLT